MLQSKKHGGEKRRKEEGGQTQAHRGRRTTHMHKERSLRGKGRVREGGRMGCLQISSAKGSTNRMKVINTCCLNLTNRISILTKPESITMTNLLKMLQKVTLSFSLAQETQKEVVRFKKQL